MIIKTAIIKKLKGGKYRLYSRKKGPDGKRRNLGTYDSLAAVKKREKAIQFFKHHADDGLADDKETRMLGELSNIATYLEEAGFVDKADKIYAVMDAIDGSMCEDYIVDHNIIPDDQLNVENQGYMGGESPIGGGYSGLNVGEAMRAEDGFWEDKKKLFEGEPINFQSSMDPDLSFGIRGHYPKDGPNATGEGYTYFICAESSSDPNWYYCFYIDYPTYSDAKRPALFFSKHLSKESIETAGNKVWEHMKIMWPDEQDNVDSAVRSNGIQGNSVIDNQNSGSFQGFSDSYFYTGYGNLEGIYGPQNR